jgi:hypothetical protein
MIDKKEDRSCGASSWSLHTDHWSLQAKKGGEAVTIIAAFTMT